MSTRKWWSCGPDSLHPPRALGPKSVGTADESWASWPPTGGKKKRNTEFTVLNRLPRRPLSERHTLVPALVVARQTEAGSDSPCCTQTAHRSGCRLHGRLWRRHAQHDCMHERRANMELSIWVCKVRQWKCLNRQGAINTMGRTQQRNTKKPVHPSLAANKPVNSLQGSPISLQDYKPLWPSQDLLSPQSTSSLKAYLFHIDFH